MPELPDINLYVHSLSKLLLGRALKKLVVKSPFLLRTVEPSIEKLHHLKVLSFSRLQKQVVWHFENDYILVVHLMIAGRFHWRRPARNPTQKNDLAAFQFEHGTMLLTEASKKKRASLHLLNGTGELSQFHQGGLEIFGATGKEFAAALQTTNRTLKRALTDPSLISGVGNAYSDEILHAAKLSPLKRTQSLADSEMEVLFLMTTQTLKLWSARLIEQTADTFPEKVTAFRPEMAVHGKFGAPCPACRTKVQRIRYAENECNYCPRCQTGGKVLADRSLSRLLKDEWPKSIDEFN